MGTKSFFSFFKRRKNSIKKKVLEKKLLDEEWQQFLYQDTYLTYTKKNTLLKKIREAAKYPWHYWLSIKLFLNRKKRNEEFEKFTTEIQIYNQNFVERRLLEYESFFEGIDDNLKFSLSMDQRIAIIKDDMHNLIIAGAGSGKTSVITSRIAYLIRRADKVEPERILALAYTRVAAQEMKERIERDFNLIVEILTFHRLGWKILKENLGEKPQMVFGGGNTEAKEKELFSKLLDNYLSKEKNQKQYIKYLAYHNERELSETSFTDKQEYFEYMRNRRYTTLNNIPVKSYSEREIANFFFIHDINFEYEPLVDWIDENTEKDYQPDFYLPEYDLYIEHWGLNKELQVPTWFSKSSKEYNEIRSWKLTQFEKYEKSLIETWEYERQEKVLIKNLKLKLGEFHEVIQFNRLPYNELVEKAYEFKEKKVEVVDLILKFVKTAKSNMLYPIDIKKRIKSGKYTKKQKLFAKIALGVYGRYQNFLRKNNKIDFDDMINEAIKYVKNAPQRYQHKYDHILIDEFQDISYQRLELIKCYVNSNTKTKLFCVGDDWQSIYHFTGSELKFFVDFSKYFPNPEETILKTNYRSTQTIVEMSNQLIQKNPTRTRKQIGSIGEQGDKVNVFELSHKYGHFEDRQKTLIFNKLKQLLEENIPPEEIVVISRFNNTIDKIKYLCVKYKMQVSEEWVNGIRFYSAHKAKGSEADHVIIMDVISGKYGFPCEIKDSSVLEIARRTKTEKSLEEERRLFYVALTRSKKHLYIYTRENSHSIFMDEIRPFLKESELINYIPFIS